MYTSGWLAPEGSVLTVEHSPVLQQVLLMLWPGGSPPGPSLLERTAPVTPLPAVKALSVTSQEKKGTRLRRKGRTRPTF